MALPKALKGVLNATEFNYTYKYTISPDTSFPDEINVNGIFFDLPFKTTLYKQGLWERFSINSDVLLQNSSTQNPNKVSSSNTVSLFTLTKSVYIIDIQYLSFLI
jgi:hypothetical protein